MNRLIGLALITVLVAGCSAGPRDFRNTNDRLRRENLELNDRIERLETDLEASQHHVATLQAQLETPVPAVEGVERSDLPRMVDIRLGRYSGLVTRDQQHTLRLYVQPVDQAGRMLPVAGRATVTLVAISPAPAD
ncbi:MAG: hypothetical protein R3336_07610, partial [Phycisphaeraceae bacterium]|nr:hypothetical protein [Phycisphaeraceae bacterium]